MKLIVNKIIGELMYRGHGDGQIDKAYGKFVVNEPYEMILDNDVENPSTVRLMPEGELLVYTCIGDEQVSSSLYIFRKGWKIEQIEKEIENIEFDEFDRIFKQVRIGYGKSKSGVPILLRDLYPDQDESKNV